MNIRCWLEYRLPLPAKTQALSTNSLHRLTSMASAHCLYPKRIGAGSAIRTCTACHFQLCASPPREVCNHSGATKLSCPPDHRSTIYPPKQTGLQSPTLSSHIHYIWTGKEQMRIPVPQDLAEFLTHVTVLSIRMDAVLQTRGGLRPDPGGAGLSALGRCHCTGKYYHQGWFRSEY